MSLLLAYNVKKKKKNKFPISLIWWDVYLHAIRCADKKKLYEMGVVKK